MGQKDLTRDRRGRKLTPTQYALRLHQLNHGKGWRKSWNLLKQTFGADSDELLNAVELVEIWTDGACWPNPGGPGSWAAILRYQSHEKTVSGFEESTTNNRMEITAAINGLRCLKRPCQVVIYSDSQYLVRTMAGQWRQGKNQDLWDVLTELQSSHIVDWRWVRGHGDDEMNCRADQLCELEMSRRGFADGSGKYRKSR